MSDRSGSIYEVRASVKASSRGTWEQVHEAQLPSS